MHCGAFSGKNGVKKRNFPNNDNRFYRFGSDSTAFIEVSSSSIEDAPQVPSMAALRLRMAEFNSTNAKAMIALHGPEKALEDAKSKFLGFCAEIQRADILSESGMMILRLDQTKAVQTLEVYCKEGGLDFTKRVAEALPQIGMRSLKDYYRMLKYADIYDMRCLGKKRSVSLLAVIEKDAGKGKKKKKAWDGETPIQAYLVKHGVNLPEDTGTPNVEAFKYEVDVLINSRRAKHEGLVISPALLEEFTRECGELKRAHFDDLNKFSGDEARLKSRLSVFVDNDGNAPRPEVDPDKIQGLIRKLDNILSNKDALEDVESESVEALKAKVAELVQKLATVA
ncbi:MAG: hypothetical protein HZB23_06130 [Deltaproteobacteria bacterium]|nr:hypothetical protein [Deltaproteobacteria bacterium]